MIKKLISNFIDIFCFVGGTFIFVHNLFGFHSVSRDYTTYYFTAFQQIQLAFGAALIALGYLIRYWRKKTDD
jgi:hypothetical protein